MEHLHAAGFGEFKISVVMTRHNIPQVEQFKAMADHYGAQLRLTRFRPSGRGADSWHELHPTDQQQRELYHWLLHRPDVLTGDSFFHLSALGEALPGLVHQDALHVHLRRVDGQRGEEKFPNGRQTIQGE